MVAVWANKLNLFWDQYEGESTQNFTGKNMSGFVNWLLH